jgi:two-component system response regulator NreC
MKRSHIAVARPRPASREAQYGSIRVVICDDHSLFREGLKSILRGDPAIEVVGEASDGRQAVDVVLRLHPDVVLMDISMPAMVGYEAIRRITSRDKHARILVLTMYEEEEMIRLCLTAGASGYILKDAPSAQLTEAIHVLRGGGRYLSPQAANKVVDQYLEGGLPTETRYDTLSGREREILKLLADGLSVKEIASELNLSLKTVDAHKYNLMRKLDLHSRTDLIKYALRRKLISFPTLGSH